MPVVSKRQARLFGLIAGGKKPTKIKVVGLSPEEAKEALRGQELEGLPLKKKKKKGNSKDNPISTQANRIKYNKQIFRVMAKKLKK